MAKNVEDVVRALKLRAEPKAKALTVRLGTKKLVLPFEVRMMASADYLFVHVPPNAGIMKMSGKALAPVDSLAEAQAASQSFRKTSKRASRKVSKVDMPTDLESALKKIPTGFKLTYGPDGRPKLVKKRHRTSVKRAAAKSTVVKRVAAKKAPARKAPVRKTAPKAAMGATPKPAAKRIVKPAVKRATKPKAVAAKTTRKPARKTVRRAKKTVAKK